MFNPPHPGSILKELYLEPLNLTVTEASLSLGVTRKTLSFLTNEKSNISSAMAIRLSVALPNLRLTFNIAINGFRKVNEERKD